MVREAWFKPKTHGYGASPANWKGWAAIAVYAASVVGYSLVMLGFERRPIDGGALALWLAGFFIATAVFAFVARRQTDGEWRWRWGADH